MPVKIDPVSFGAGYLAGLVTALLARRLRPVAVEILATLYAAFDGVGYAAHVERERFEDLLAEARHRARERAGRAAPGRKEV